MSIFGTIMSKIFGSGSAEAAPSSTAPSGPSKGNETPTPPASGQAEAGAPSTAPSSVDVAQVLDGMDTGGQKLDWRHSIVDLMKLLHLDSSHENRKALATELHYTGDMNDSASMNMWLHKEVMKKLAENGGKVPAGLH